MYIVRIFYAAISTFAIIDWRRRRNNGSGVDIDAAHKSVCSALLIIIVIKWIDTALRAVLLDVCQLCCRDKGGDGGGGNRMLSSSAHHLSFCLLIFGVSMIDT